ncbi:MAG: CoA transferase, partial [Chloroflexi bacterium]|nr:CoA transferase [Chloroflexota bacterium]
MAGPLEGIRVVEAAQIYATPGLGMYLADFGADVIKVEPPEGDACRRQHTSPVLGDLSKPFIHLNRNKRSIVVDIRKPAGRSILLRLLERADVFVVNFRPGVPERLGLHYEALERLNPRLIYVSLTGWGPSGPRKGRRGYDLLVQARAGLLDARRYQDGTPVLPPFMAADPSAPMLLAYGVALALYEREKSGRGQKIESSLFAATIAMQNSQLVRLERDPTFPSTMNHASFLYRCADDKHLILIIVVTEEWVRLCRALGLAQFAEDPRFATYMDRARHHAVIDDILAPTFATRPRDHWLALFANEDLPCEPIVTRDDLLADPQARENGYLTDVDDQRAGRVTMMGAPLRLSRTPAGFRRPAPHLGQHADEVLREIGLTP